MVSPPVVGKEKYMISLQSQIALPSAKRYFFLTATFSPSLLLVKALGTMRFLRWEKGHE